VQALTVRGGGGGAGCSAAVASLTLLMKGISPRDGHPSTQFAIDSAAAHGIQALVGLDLCRCLKGVVGVDIVCGGRRSRRGGHRINAKGAIVVRSQPSNSHGRYTGKERRRFCQLHAPTESRTGIGLCLGTNLHNSFNSARRWKGQLFFNKYLRGNAAAGWTTTTNGCRLVIGRRRRRRRRHDADPDQGVCGRLRRNPDPRLQIVFQQARR